VRKKGAKHLVISWKLDVFEVGSWISLDVAVDETFGRGYKAFGLDSWDLDSQSISLVWASSIGAGVVSAPHGPSFPALRFRMMGLGTASISFIGRSTRPLGHTWPVEPPKIRHPSFGTHECHNMSQLDSRGFSCCQQSRPNSLVKRLAKHLAQKTPSTFGCTLLIAGGLQRADR